MNNLGLIIKNEFLTDIRSKSFWIATFLFPVLMIAFGIVIGIMATDSETLTSVASLGRDPDEDLSGAQVAGMMVGACLSIFIMVYGAMIFQKVRTEKCNRIIEILATCVEGRTMMLAKVISVGMLGVTQLLVWGICLIALLGTLALMAGNGPDASIFFNATLWRGLAWGVLFFIGGYIFFGSMFAAVGAMTDKNNENQEYMSMVTFILLGGFYISMFIVDNPHSSLATWCGFIPFTSPTVGAVNAISGAWPFWMAALSLLVLYGCAFISISLAGKIYTSSLLLKGKKLSPKDIVAFLKSK